VAIFHWYWLILTSRLLVWHKTHKIGLTVWHKFFFNMTSSFYMIPFLSLTFFKTLNYFQVWIIFQSLTLNANAHTWLHISMYLGTWKLQNFPMCLCSLSSSHLQSRHKRSKRILHLSPTAGPVPGWDGPPHCHG